MEAKNLIRVSAGGTFLSIIMLYINLLANDKFDWPYDFSISMGITIIDPRVFYSVFVVISFMFLGGVWILAKQEKSWIVFVVALISVALFPLLKVFAHQIPFQRDEKQEERHQTIAILFTLNILILSVLLVIVLKRWKIMVFIVLQMMAIFSMFITSSIWTEQLNKYKKLKEDFSQHKYNVISKAFGISEIVTAVSFLMLLFFL